MDGLADKVVIIPGGATKIGAAVATAFVLSGAKVVIADINIDGGEAAAATHDDSAIFTKTDISSDEEIENLVTTTIEHFGRIDFLVNVACSYEDDGAESSRDQWLESFNINLVGSVMLMKAARTELARNKGAIVNFGSISARAAQTGRCPVSVLRPCLFYHRHGYSSRRRILRHGAGAGRTGNASINGMNISVNRNKRRFKL